MGVRGLWALDSWVASVQKKVLADHRPPTKTVHVAHSKASRTCSTHELRVTVVSRRKPCSKRLDDMWSGPRGVSRWSRFAARLDTHHSRVQRLANIAAAWPSSSRAPSNSLVVSWHSTPGRLSTTNRKMSLDCSRCDHNPLLAVLLAPGGHINSPFRYRCLAPQTVPPRWRNAARPYVDRNQALLSRAANACSDAGICRASTRIVNAPRKVWRKQKWGLLA